MATQNMHQGRVEGPIDHIVKCRVATCVENVFKKVNPDYLFLLSTFNIQNILNRQEETQMTCKLSPNSLHAKFSQLLLSLPVPGHRRFLFLSLCRSATLSWIISAFWTGILEKKKKNTSWTKITSTVTRPLLAENTPKFSHRTWSGHGTVYPPAAKLTSHRVEMPAGQTTVSQQLWGHQIQPALPVWDRRKCQRPRSLDFLVEEVSALRQQQTQIQELIDQLKSLRVKNDNNERKISHLENWVAELEQYTRMNDIIITGLKIKPRTYARAVTTNNGEEPGELDVSSTEQQVATFLRSRGIEMDCDNIEACHPLPRRNLSDQPAVIRFANRKHKREIQKQGRKLKGTNVYINEHLTSHNAAIARAARHLKKQKKIQHTWTSNCKIFIKLNGNSTRKPKCWWYEVWRSWTNTSE